MASGSNRFFVGAYLGDGAATQSITVSGFKPRYVKIVSYATGTVVEQFEGMAELGTAKAGGLKHPTDLVAAAFLTAAQGVTLDDTGFTVGTDAGVNSDGLSYFYVCTD